MSWKILLDEPRLCEGGRLVSIVYCCDPTKVSCPIVEHALKILGLSKEEFAEAMRRHGVEVPSIDGTCFGNLAFCPPLDHPSRDRDEALRRLGWDAVKYAKFKWDLLTKIIPKEKLRIAMNTRIVTQFAVSLLDLETRKEYKAFGLGNVDLKFIRLTEVFREGELRDREVEETLRNSEFVAARIPKQILEEIDALVAKGIVKSRSDAIRRALMLYISSLRKTEREG